MLKLELVLSVLAVAWAFAFPRAGARWFERIENFFQPLAERRTLSVIAVGILAVVARVAVLPVLPIPAPAIHDEFSYLLMADTFAHGRLANPTPPLWVHFETFHVIETPTYVSIYYPGQGLFLAVGQILFGHPFWGVVLSSTLMCAAICWMLQGWVPAGWAFLGGILAVIRLGTFSYWADSYWGGAVAALGGALVLGAFPRIKDDGKTRHAIFFALGIGLLFNTRPYESIFFLMPVVTALAIWLLRQRGARLANLLRSVLSPAVICLLVIAGFMGYYFWRTTTSPFNTPYLIDLKTYVPSSLFPWGKMGIIPDYNHKTLRDFYLGWELHQHDFARAYPVALLIIKLVLLWLFYLGPALTVPILLVVVFLRAGFRVREVQRDVWLFLVIALSCLVGIALPVVLFPHYAAPLTSIVYAIVILTFRFLYSTETGSLRSRAAVNLILLVCVVLVPIRALAGGLGVGVTHPILKTWCSSGVQLADRPRVVEALEAVSGKHLVIVQYSVTHDPGSEWVYNGADIEHEKIIWARDMGPAKNQELIDYFKGRRVWLLEPDENPPRLQPYPVQGRVSGACSPESLCFSIALNSR